MAGDDAKAASRHLRRGGAGLQACAAPEARLRPWAGQEAYIANFETLFMKRCT